VVSITTRENAARPVVEAAQQPLQGVDQVAPQGAAQASGGERDDAVVHLLDQQMIDADLAELIDDHRRIGERGVAQQAVEERRLAGAEEAGQDADRDRRRRPARSFACRCHCVSVFGAVAIVGFGLATVATAGLGFVAAAGVSLGEGFAPADVSPGKGFTPAGVSPGHGLRPPIACGRGSAGAASAAGGAFAPGFAGFAAAGFAAAGLPGLLGGGFAAMTVVPGFFLAGAGGNGSGSLMTTAPGCRAGPT
jgi:hypothetical protein